MRSQRVLLIAMIVCLLGIGLLLALPINVVVEGSARGFFTISNDNARFLDTSIFLLFGGATITSSLGATIGIKRRDRTAGIACALVAVPALAYLVALPFATFD